MLFFFKKITFWNGNNNKKNLASLVICLYYFGFLSKQDFDDTFLMPLDIGILFYLLPIKDFWPAGRWSLQIMSSSSREFIISWKPIAGSGCRRDQSLRYTESWKALSIFLNEGNSTFHPPVSHWANSPADGSEVPSDLQASDDSHHTH